jgi:hypothetical protein
MRDFAIAAALAILIVGFAASPATVHARAPEAQNAALCAALNH